MFSNDIIIGKAKHCRSPNLEQTDISAGLAGLLQVTSKRTWERMMARGHQGNSCPGIALLCIWTHSPIAACE